MNSWTQRHIASLPAMIDAIMRSPRMPWISTLARLVLGVVMFYAGILKLFEPDEALRAVQAYRILPAAIDDVVAFGLPLLEAVVGVLLLLGLGTRLAAWITGGLLILFIAGITSAWARGLSIDCGCFGGGGDVLATGKTWRYTSEILRDTGLLVLAIWLARFPTSHLALDRLLDPGPSTDELDQNGTYSNERHKEPSA